jgi:hypothetical protein
MTLRADEAEHGKYYRLTRDSGTTYYTLCDAAQKRRLEKRLGKQNPRFMKADDRFALQALERTRTGHVLAIRVTRFRGQDGRPRETRAFVAFPPDYTLREVAKPPGYTSAKRSSGKTAGADNGLDRGASGEETLEGQRKEPGSRGEV